MGELEHGGLRTEQEAAVYFKARERRLSLAGIPKLFRTHQLLNAKRTLTITGATNATPIVITIVGHGLLTGMTVTIADVTGNTAANGTWAITALTADTFSLDTSVGNGAYAGGGTCLVTPDLPVPLIDTDAVFPARAGVVTFRTAVRITGANPLGLVFEFGGSTRGIGLGINGNLMAFVAGGLTNDAGLALFDNTVDLPVGLELDLVATASAGDGRVRLWGNGQELARDTSTNRTFGGDWASIENGSFARVGAGTVHPLLTTANQNPANFEVIEPLSVYMGQAPRQFA